MAPPVTPVRAVKGGVYLNPTSKRGTHVWRFAKAVVSYALGVMLFPSAIFLLLKQNNPQNRTPRGAVD